MNHLVTTREATLSHLRSLDREWQLSDGHNFLRPHRERLFQRRRAGMWDLLSETVLMVEAIVEWRSCGHRLPVLDGRGDNVLARVCYDTDFLNNGTELLAAQCRNGGPLGVLAWHAGLDISRYGTLVQMMI